MDQLVDKRDRSIDQDSGVVCVLCAVCTADELPDVVLANWLQQPGGPQAMIDPEVILPLNDLIESDAPNLKKVLEEHPDCKW